jgi:phosphotriesterase-related protein
MTGVIRTIGGDLPVEQAGPTYVHEHLIIDTPLVASTMPEIHLYSVEEAVAEVHTCVASGVRTMVDAMPAASGRDPDRLSRISVLTGMRIVAATGLHTEKYYKGIPWTREEPAEALAARFIADIEEGIDRHDYRGASVERGAAVAGVVKVATLDETLSSRDGQVFEAVAMTVAQTGVPVLTHTEAGRGGMQQIERLLSLGVPAERIALSHTDKVTDTGYHRDMLSTGVFLCYDQGLRDPATTFGLITTMVEHGFEHRIVLGTDGARRSLWATLGGAPGLAALYRRSVADLAPALAETLLVTNPATFLRRAR